MNTWGVFFITFFICAGFAGLFLAHLEEKSIDN